jgi:hypothetical protein
MHGFRIRQPAAVAGTRQVLQRRPRSARVNRPGPCRGAKVKNLEGQECLQMAQLRPELARAGGES